MFESLSFQGKLLLLGNFLLLCVLPGSFGHSVDLVPVVVCLVAQLYQLSRLFKGVSRPISLILSPKGNVSLNSSMVKAWLALISATAASSLNWAMCLLIELPVFIHRDHSMSSASPTKSNMENTSTSSFLKSVYRPSLSFGLAGAGHLFACSIN